MCVGVCARARAHALLLFREGTVRDLSNQEKVQHLQEAFPSLQLFEADLLKDGSFTECFQGCLTDSTAHTPGD